MRQILNTFRQTILPAILNSYSVIFFSFNKIFASTLILVSFFNFYAGLSGFLAVLVSVLIANTMGLDKLKLSQGLFSFNALLTGIGMGTFFDPSLVFFSLLMLAALMSLILSATLGSWLGKYGLPFLSIPFVICFWLVVLPASQFENLGLTQRSIYWMNDVYALGGNSLLHFFQTIDTLPLNKMVDIYLRSMSSLFFQSNLVTGLMIAVGLLISSRITFSLSILGFVAAYLFAQFTGSETASITYYNIGANYIMVAIAIGGFFVIPSIYSYLWTVLLVPLTSLLLLFMSKFFDFYQLPIFSLPFSIVVILFVYFLQLRVKPTKLILTPEQHYSPEINLYTFKNNKDRLSNLYYLPLYLPFWGQWKVSQGQDGKHTHKGDWGKAFDFVIQDDEGKNYSGAGLFCENFYCYNKPLLAPADGVIEEIIDNIDDNEIGKINTIQNWGNTIIIRHYTGLYTQMSHLKKGSFKVKQGDFVKQGDLLALCGNSGRSPEPHLHFQVQASPYLGSKTIDYPFGYYFKYEKGMNILNKFSRPKENELLSGLNSNVLLKAAFDILPNTSMKFSFVNHKGIKVIEKWDAYTDSYNFKYLHCQATESTAYYVNDGSTFYFTSFYGDEKSLLYYFYLSAYKVFLQNLESDEIKDVMPLSVVKKERIKILLHDFAAPFYNYMQVVYSMKVALSDDVLDTDNLILNSKIQLSTFGRRQNDSASSIHICKNSIKEFNYTSSNLNIHATCVN